MPSRKFSSITDVPDYLVSLKNKSFTYEATIGCWEIAITPVSFIEEWFEESEEKTFPLDQKEFTISLIEKLKIHNLNPLYSYKSFSICNHPDFANLKFSEDKKWESKDRVDCSFDELCELLYYMDRLTGLAAFR